MNRVVEVEELAGAEPVKQRRAQALVDAPQQDERWELPKDWLWARLGDVLPLSYGKALPERVRDNSGHVPVFGSAGLAGFHSIALAPANSVIVGRKGNAGAVHRSLVPCWPIDTAYFTIGTPAIDIGFGYWFLIFCKLGSFDQSTAIPSLSRDTYNRVYVPLPPLAEQQRIVARIDALFADIANGEAALTAARDGLDTFRRALLKAAVTGELTADWRETNHPAETGHDLIAQVRAERAGDEQDRKRGRRSTVEASVEPVLPESLPTTWAWTNLGELFNISTGSTPSRADPSLWNGEIPWVSSGEVAFCRIEATRETISATGLGNRSTRLHPPGTVLLAMIGEGKTRGQCAILDVPAANNQNAAAIRVSSTPIPPEFVYHSLEQRYLSSRKESQGGNQPALNAGKVAAMGIALPPLTEITEILRRISDVLAALDDTLAMLDAEAANAVRLRQSVLKAAFAGRLMPQDPTDEPAAALLTRLKVREITSWRSRTVGARRK